MVGLFLLANILPLGIAVYLLVRYLQGDLPELQLAEGTGQNLAVLGVALLLLILVASFSLPTAHRTTKRIEALLRWRVAILTGRAHGSRLASLLLYLPLLTVYVLMALLRFSLTVLALGILAVCIIFIVRLLDPDFLQKWLEDVLSYRSS